MLAAADAHLDQPIDVREERGRIVIEPLYPVRYDIDALIACIADDNRHDPVDMSKPVEGEFFSMAPGYVADAGDIA